MKPDQEDQDSGIDPDDGMAEDVGPRGPLRTFEKAISLEDAILQAGAPGPQGLPEKPEDYDLISYRGPGGFLQVSISHYPIFNALWTLWAQRRGSVEEAGITAFEVSDAIGIPRERTARVLTALKRGGAVREIARSLGGRGVRTQYFPSQLGVKMFALAATLGYGVQIQVGRTVRAWKTRSLEEPSGIFDRARLLQGRAP